MLVYTVFHYISDDVSTPDKFYILVFVSLTYPIFFSVTEKTVYVVLVMHRNRQLNVDYCNRRYY